MCVYMLISYAGSFTVPNAQATLIRLHAHAGHAEQITSFVSKSYLWILGRFSGTDRETGHYVVHLELVCTSKLCDKRSWCVKWDFGAKVNLAPSEDLDLVLNTAKPM